MYGKKVKQLRNALALTQAEFAQRLGISSPALSKIESDQTNPSAETTAKLISTFGVNLNWLYSDQGDMFNLQDGLALQEQPNTPYGEAEKQKGREYQMLLKLSEAQEKLIEQIEENKRLRKLMRTRLEEMAASCPDDEALQKKVREAMMDFGRTHHEG